MVFLNSINRLGITYLLQNCTFILHSYPSHTHTLSLPFPLFFFSFSLTYALSLFPFPFSSVLLSHSLYYHPLSLFPSLSLLTLFLPLSLSLFLHFFSHSLIPAPSTFTLLTLLPSLTPFSSIFLPHSCPRHLPFPFLSLSIALSTPFSPSFNTLNPRLPPFSSPYMYLALYDFWSLASPILYLPCFLLLLHRIFHIAAVISDVLLF